MISPPLTTSQCHVWKSVWWAGPIKKQVKLITIPTTCSLIVFEMFEPSFEEDFFVNFSLFSFQSPDGEPDQCRGARSLRRAEGAGEAVRTRPVQSDTRSLNRSRVIERFFFLNKSDGVFFVYVAAAASTRTV